MATESNQTAGATGPAAPPATPTRNRHSAGIQVEKRAAILTIFDAPAMTKRGRKQIAAWMRKQADFLEKHGQEYAKRFTARYLYK